LKTTKIRNSTPITFHSVKGNARLKGNERTNYLAKTVASYNIIIACDVIPFTRGKQSLEEYYTKIWNATYVNCAIASPHYNIHTQHLSLWPNSLLTQFLTNHC
jgi:hypothetical protein